MSKKIKITIELPETLLRHAQMATGLNITETICMGLKLLASAKAYKELRGLKGKVKFTKTYKELKVDRHLNNKPLC